MHSLLYRLLALLTGERLALNGTCRHPHSSCLGCHEVMHKLHGDMFTN